MKRNNNLLKVTNLKTNETWWCTKTTYVGKIIGCTPAAVFCEKYKNDYKVEILDGSEVKWKDINKIDIILRNKNKEE